MNPGSIPYESYDLLQQKAWKQGTSAPANFSQLLLGSLCDLLAEAFTDYLLPTPKGNTEVRAPLVFLHGMPDDEDTVLYPFFLVRWVDRQIASEDDHKTVLTDEVGIIVGINAPETQEQAGWLLADVLDIACNAIWRARLLASRFELVEPLRASIPSAAQKVHLYHMATITTRWTFNWPPKALPELTRVGTQTGVLL